eukprot:jgi/Mesen1/11018/ME000098S10418
MFDSFNLAVLQEVNARLGTGMADLPDEILEPILRAAVRSQQGGAVSMPQVTACRCVSRTWDRVLRGAMERVRLADNKVDAGSALAALRAYPRVRHVSLGHCLQDSNFDSGLLRGLAAEIPLLNSCDFELSFEWEGLPDLEHFLSHRTTLRALRLSFVEWDHPCQMLPSLAAMHALQDLHLEFEFSTRICTSEIESLAGLQSLTSLTLTYWCLSGPEAAWDSLARAVFNPRLTKLHLRCDRLPQLRAPMPLLEDLNVRIQTPVKGESCHHHQCFDFDSFLAANEVTPLWRCPCCYAPVSRRDLRLDCNFLAVLEQASGDPGVTKVRMKPSGEWAPVVEEEAEGVLAGPSASAARPARVAWGLPAVIELESDDDGGEEQPEGGQVGSGGDLRQAGEQSLSRDLTGVAQQGSAVVTASTMQQAASRARAAASSSSTLGAPAAARATSRQRQARSNASAKAARMNLMAAPTLEGVRPPRGQQQQQQQRMSMPPVVQPARLPPGVHVGAAAAGSSLKRKRPLQQEQQQVYHQEGHQQLCACFVTLVSGVPPLYFFRGAEHEYHQQLQQRSQTAGVPSGASAGGQVISSPKILQRLVYGAAASSPLRVPESALTLPDPHVCARGKWIS